METICETGDLDILYDILNNREYLAGWSPLHEACKYGNIDIVRFLCENKKMNINIQDINGWTPLHCAVLENYFNIVQYLCDIGANVRIKNNDGYMPIYYANRNNYSDIEKCLYENDIYIKLKNKTISCKENIVNALNKIEKEYYS